MTFHIELACQIASSYPLYTHRPVGFLIGVLWSLINLGIMDIFMILSLLIHEYGIFSIFVLLSLNNCLLCRSSSFTGFISRHLFFFCCYYKRHVWYRDVYMERQSWDLIRVLIFIFFMYKIIPHVDGFCFFHSNYYTFDIMYALLN